MKRGLNGASKLILPGHMKQAEPSTTPDDEPLFSTDLHETLGIRKFLEMSMADLRDQVARAAKDPKIVPKQFKMIKAHALILTTWMISAMQMTDQMLAEAKATAPGMLADDQRVTGC